MSAPAPCCTPTTPRSRCWRRAWARPGPGGSGLWCATNGPGARQCRRRRSTATRPTAAASRPRRCWAPAWGSCTPTAMLGSTGSTSRRRPRANHPWSRWLAGRMRAGNSLTCTTPPPRPSRSTPCNGLLPCSPSRPASRAARPSAGPRRAGNTPSRRAQELDVLRLRCRRPASSLRLHHHRNRQDARPQPASLSGRHPRTHRRPPQPATRRPTSLEVDTVAPLRPAPNSQYRGLKRTLTCHRRD